MSAKLRKEAEKLRAKYARVMGVPIERVTIAYGLDRECREIAEVRCPGFPRWDTGPLDWDDLE